MCAYAGEDMAEGSVSFVCNGSPDEVKVKTIFEIDFNQSSRIRSITFVNQDLDSPFVTYWYGMFCSCNLDSLSFIDCRFIDWNALAVLNGIVVASLTVRNCALTVREANEILRYICYSGTRNVDLSDNQLDGSFRCVLYQYIYTFVYIEMMNLSGNNFDQDSIDQIKSDNERDGGIGQFIF
jgi:hypothetical protein